MPLYTVNSIEAGTIPGLVKVHVTYPNATTAVLDNVLPSQNLFGYVPTNDTEKALMITLGVPWGSPGGSTSGQSQGAATGVTSNPTTSSASFSVLTDMSVTGAYGAGSIFLDFSCVLSLASTAITSDGVEFAFFVDGVEIPTQFRRSIKVSGVTINLDNISAEMSAIAQVTSGTHTIDVRWRKVGSSASVTSLGTTRMLRVVGGSPL